MAKQKCPAYTGDRVQRRRLAVGDHQRHRRCEAGDAGAIKVDDLTLKNTIVTLGGQLSYAVSTSWGAFMPNARLELQRRVQGSGRIVGAQLVADGAINSRVALETVDRDYGNASLGFSVVLPRGISGFANWETAVRTPELLELEVHRRSALRVLIDAARRTGRGYLLVASSTTKSAAADDCGAPERTRTPGSS